MKNFPVIFLKSVGTEDIIQTEGDRYDVGTEGKDVGFDACKPLLLIVAASPGIYGYGVFSVLLLQRTRHNRRIRIFGATDCIKAVIRRVKLKAALRHAVAEENYFFRCFKLHVSPPKGCNHARKALCRYPL